MTTKKTPTISIGLCTFNGERFLREQLDSIERQTLLPYEVVACDDGSTDNTMSMLDKFARRARFPVRIIQNKRRLGVSANFAKAVSECRGDYYAPCDQDDVWLPQRLETFAGLLSQHPYGLIFSDAFLIDELSRRLDYTVWQRVGVRRRERARIASGKALEVLVQRTLVTGATMILSRELLSVAFPLPPDLPKPIIQDGWLALLAAARREIAAVNRPLMFYRRHASQQVGLPSVIVPPIGTRMGRLFCTGNPQTKHWISNHHAAMDATLDRVRILRRLLAERVNATTGWINIWDAAIGHLEIRQHLPRRFIPRSLRVLSRARAYTRFSPAPIFDMRRDIFHPYRSAHD